MRNDEIRQRFLDFRRRLYGQHDLGAVDAHLDPQFVSHNPLVRGSGVAAYKGFVEGVFFRGVPDLHPVSQRVLVEGDQLMAMTRWQATHSGPFLGVPATGKALQFATADLFRLRDGLLAEHWDVVDRLDASIALGLVRPAAAP